MCNKKKIVFLLFSSSIVPLVFFLGNVFAHGSTVGIECYGCDGSSSPCDATHHGYVFYCPNTDYCELIYAEYAGKHVWSRGCGLNMTNFVLPVTIGCVPVNNLGIKGMTCWCKTNLCNRDLILNDRHNPDNWPIKTEPSKYRDTEF